MKANVSLQARLGDSRWTGSGIIVAREGPHLAILTNRHVVENTATGQPATLRALTVAGDLVPGDIVWRAERGVDLAVVEARVDHPGPLGLVPLSAGAGPRIDGGVIGDPVFMVANPLDLAWSYTRGVLSAIRHWTTREGQSVRLLQTDGLVAPGSSGGGIFAASGHLLGVLSFLKQGRTGDSVHFAVSLETVRATLTREQVRWRGHALLEISVP